MWDRRQVIALISLVCSSAAGVELGCDQKYSTKMQFGAVEWGSDIGMLGLEMAVASAAGTGKGGAWARRASGHKDSKTPHTSYKKFDDDGHPVDGTKLPANEALDAAAKWIGTGYREPVKGSGRFVSKDGERVARMGDSDSMGAHGGGPHI